jgi:hypothetical protein
MTETNRETGAPIWALRRLLARLAWRFSFVNLALWLSGISLEPPTADDIAWAQRIAKELGL